MISREIAASMVSTALNSVGQTKLRLRLESSEPKCANCAKWGRILVGDMEVTTGICNGPARSEWKSAGLNASVSCGLVTTDLSVCSKWEPKT